MIIGFMSSQKTTSKNMNYPLSAHADPILNGKIISSLITPSTKEKPLNRPNKY